MSTTASGREVVGRFSEYTYVLVPTARTAYLADEIQGDLLRVRGTSDWAATCLPQVGEQL